jgi:CRP/FNR family cyclic AMP-dependent transcriptional regulator
MYEDALAQAPLFADLTRKELQTIGKSCRERDYPQGATLIQQGDTGAGLFIIISGHAQVVQDVKDLDDTMVRRTLTTIGPGDTIGEMALLDDLPRSASVIATDPCRCLLLPQWDFRAALRESPDIAIKLLTVLSRRLRQAEQVRHAIA